MICFTAFGFLFAQVVVAHVVAFVAIVAADVVVARCSLFVSCFVVTDVVAVARSLSIYMRGNLFPDIQI